MKILIIEDSPRLLRSLGHGLRRLGHAVDLVPDGREGYDHARFGEHDVIVLDLMLPGMDGLALLKNLRAVGRQTHVLILSAKDQVADRVRGLELGADDYLVKPFAFDELRARLDSLARRRYQRKNPDITLGAFTVHAAKREVSCEGRVIDLTRSEYALLENLAFNRGRVRSKDQLLEVLSNGESCAESNVVEVVVCNLRKKLGRAGEAPVIRTRRGYGYYVS